MALLATNRFAGDGVTTSYEINFVGKYLDKSHVFAYVEDDVTGARTPVAITAANWLNDTTLQGMSAVPVGKTMVIYRNTPAAPLVDFVSGAWLTPNALNTATRQGLFKAVESSDGGGGTGGPVSWADIQGKPYASSLVPGIVKVGSGLAISPSGVLSATGGGGGGSGGGGPASWGAITGTLGDQADLVLALATKANIADLPPVPTHVSQLTNDSGFVTASTPVIASEPLTAGDWVSLWDSGGDARVRKSDHASLDKEVDGYVLVGVASGAVAEVFTSGMNTAVAGQQLGPVFAEAAGAGSASVGAGAAFAQRIGTAIRPDAVVFSRGPAVGLF